MKKSILFKCALVVSLLYALPVYSQINFPLSSSYKYLKGNEAQSLAQNWGDIDFDDSGWNSSLAPFRYGDGNGGTELSDMKGNYSSLYLRTSFEASKVDLLTEVNVNTDWDDGFVLFINGVEVHSSQAPATISYDALASGLHEYGEAQSVVFTANDLGIVEGSNTIAVFACNTSLGNSSDFYFDMSISATTSTPELIDTLGISYSHPSGFYDQAFTLSISSPVPGASILYTLDGSNPQTSTSAIVDTSPIILEVSETLEANLGSIPSVLVRASIQTEGYKPSKPLTRTFIYPEEVKVQKHPGGPWPSSNTNGQYLDFEMDSEVVDNPIYTNSIDEAFMSIPSISIVTDLDNLFDSNTGIYVNAKNQGELWEKECSVELLDSDSTKGFNVNAGLRIRGGASRNDKYPKHSFRLFFRSDYGAAKLDYPLFENEGVDKFDKIDLRCAQNYSWANSSGQKNTFAREVFSRDSQRAIGQPYTRSRYYHLFLNGMYWGLYMSQERSEARYAESYFGDDYSDYDVIKVTGSGNYSLKATDGTMDKWADIYAMCTTKGFANNADYYALEGKDANGKSVAGGEVWVDIDNLIDYMINIFYSGNYDAPVSRFLSNAKPNNMYAITNHTNKSEGFRFFAHDAEHSLFSTSENRVNLADLESKTMNVTEFQYFHVQWLHHKLSENEEYRMRFSDRAAQSLNTGGLFDADSCLVRFNKRAARIDKAIIAESARWGDGYRDAPFTRNDWVSALNYVRNDYFPVRGDIVKSQLSAYDLYPTIEAPRIVFNGTLVVDKVYEIETQVSAIMLSGGNGTVYYTTDGTDPRLIGGNLSSSAIILNSSHTIDITESSVIKARILGDNSWGALKEVTFLMEQTDYSALKVTELHYHPSDSIVAVGDTIDGNDYEFIEFKNTSATAAIDLSGVSFVSGIKFTFEDNVVLPPQAYYVIAARPSKFYDRYGIVADGNYSKSFSNGGEEVILITPDSLAIMDFTYSDEAPWPLEADGGGHSLVSVNTNPDLDSNPNIPWYWTASSKTNGSPKSADANTTTSIEENIIIQPALNVQVYPNPTNGVFTVNVQGIVASYDIKVLSMDGRMIHNGNYTGKAILDMSNYNVNYGVFLIQVNAQGQFQTYKMVYLP